MLLQLYLISGVALVQAAVHHSKRQLFEPATQLIDVSGAHAFAAPGTSDLRGPCPALNALANHGYIARNGYTNLTEATNAVMQVYGTDFDLAFNLATIGVVEAGDGIHFSIGGPPGPGLPVVSGLLGQPRGISNSHNRFEGDASPARGDLYQFGEAYLTQMPFFQGLYNLPGSGTSNPSYSLDLLGNYAATRYQQSKSQNPYFFRGFIGFLIPPGTLGLIAHLFSNKSTTYPEGFLDPNTLKSFYAMTGPDGNDLTYTPGGERIPENWYPFAPETPYTPLAFVEDFATIVQQHPELLAFGGNTGTVNSFTGLDIQNLTGGLYNAKTLLNGNNLGCFLLQSEAVAAPDLIRGAGVIADITGAVSQINSAVAQGAISLNCPQLSQYNYNSGQLNQYPGYTQLKADGTYS